MTCRRCSSNKGRSISVVVRLSKFIDNMKSELLPHETSCLHGVISVDEIGDMSATRVYRGWRDRIFLIRLLLHFTARTAVAAATAAAISRGAAMLMLIMMEIFLGCILRTTCFGLVVAFLEFISVGYRRLFHLIPRESWFRNL